MTRLLLLPFCALLLAAAPSPSRSNPQIDFGGFVRLSGQVESYRQSRLLPLKDFQAKARKRDALLLDARSKDAFAAGHLKGAVNLPLTDFTAASLERLIGDPERPVLIYCNNNFSNDVPPVPVKALTLALNIQTFVNLVGYGYSNVYELDDVVDFNDPAVGWVKG